MYPVWVFFHKHPSEKCYLFNIMQGKKDVVKQQMATASISSNAIP